MVRKKIQLAPKSKLGYNDKLKMCDNCWFCQISNNGLCPFENINKNYNDKCTIYLKNWPHSFFRYRFDLPYKLLEINK